MNLSKMARSFKKTIALMLAFTVFMSLFAINLTAAVPFTLRVVGSHEGGQAILSVFTDYGTDSGHLGAEFDFSYNGAQLEFVNSTPGTGLEWEANVVPQSENNVIRVNVSTMNEVNESGSLLWRGVFNIIDDTLEADDVIEGFGLTLVGYMNQDWDMPAGHEVNLSNAGVRIPNLPFEGVTFSIALGDTVQNRNRVVATIAADPEGSSGVAYLVVTASRAGADAAMWASVTPITIGAEQTIETQLLVLPNSHVSAWLVYDVNGSLTVGSENIVKGGIAVIGQQ